MWWKGYHSSTEGIWKGYHLHHFANHKLWLFGQRSKKELLFSPLVPQRKREPGPPDCRFPTVIKRTNNINARYLLQVSINCGGHGDGTAISPRGHSSESFVPVMHYHAQELLSCMIFFFQVFSQWFKACLHGGVGPQVREVTCLRWGNPPDHISHFNLITFTW